MKTYKLLFGSVALTLAVTLISGCAVGGSSAPTTTTSSTSTSTSTSTSSTTTNPLIGITWSQGTDIPLPRRSGACTAYDNKLWLIGGRIISGGNDTNEVISSINGSSWSSSFAPWSARSWFSATVFDNKIWIYGGEDGGYLDDLWSFDGSSWTETTITGPGPGERAFPFLLNHDSKLWLIGGGSEEGEEEIMHTDIWSSADGSSWTREVAALPYISWVGGAATHGGEIIVFGGTEEGEAETIKVIASTNGTDWSLKSDDPGWEFTWSENLTSFDGKLWVCGGGSSVGEDDIYYPKVYSSTNGASWTLVTSEAPWMPGEGPFVTVFNNKLWYIGGESADSVMTKEVWYTPAD